MAWETRPCGRYYYESVRIGKRITRRYIGTGPLAELVAEQHAEARAKRRDAARARETLIAYLSEMDPLMEQHHEAVDLILCGALLAAGYHRPRYQKTWRKRLERRHLDRD